MTRSSDDAAWSRWPPRRKPEGALAERLAEQVLRGTLIAIRCWPHDSPLGRIARNPPTTSAHAPLTLPNVSPSLPCHED